jgi:hypothetical protein
MGMTQVPLAETASGYRHEAFLYSGTAEFRTGTMPFIRRAIAEPGLEQPQHEAPRAGHRDRHEGGRAPGAGFRRLSSAS